MTTDLVPYNANVLSHSPGSQKPDMGLPGVEPGQGCVPFRTQGEIWLLRLSGFQRPPAFCSSWSPLHLRSQRQTSHCTLTPLPPSSPQKKPCDHAGPTWRTQDNLPSQNPEWRLQDPLAVKRNILAVPGG
uniref:Uncharacterized protein n=1 Tax=Rousettus aegyptiacus TaxID=9407 RepID=A0A7J8DHY3_ROUAE|nr:hypothetical protein HJG63_008497 [Rousettus aegyptiacus]